jgi:DNA-binding IclR family transcriptional regulator
LSNQRAEPSRSVVSRLTAILLTFRSGNSHSVTEIARLTRLPVSTAHRLTAELASWQLLRRASDGRYEVGANLQRLRYEVDLVPDLYDRAPLVVSDLCDVTSRRARLGVLREGRVAYIEKQPGPGPATAFSANAVLPAHATAVGKALLAFAPQGTVASVEQGLTAYTSQTLNTPNQLHRALRSIRLTRTAVARGELVAGDWAVAVPVFGRGGLVVAALELQVRDRRTDIETYTALLTVAARGLSRELSLTGYRTGRGHLRLASSPHAGEEGIPTSGVASRVTEVT